MARSRRKTHDVFARPEDMAGNPRPGGTGEGGPYLPTVGDVVRVKSYVRGSSDPSDRRPSVVVAVPSTHHGVIQVATRTTDTTVKGVPHPRDPSLHLGEDGVFSDLNNVEQHDWTRANVRYEGVLPEPYLAQVLARFS